MSLVAARSYKSLGSAEGDTDRGSQSATARPGHLKMRARRYYTGQLAWAVTDKVAPRRKLARGRMRQQHDDGVKQVCVAYHEMVRGVLVGEREGMTDQPEIY